MSAQWDNQVNSFTIKEEPEVEEYSYLDKPSIEGAPIIVSEPFVQDLQQTRSGPILFLLGGLLTLLTLGMWLQR